MQKISHKRYHYNHIFLGKIETEVYRASYNNKPVDIYFSHAKDNDPHKIRIENIIYSDDKINSFGIYSNQINLGPLSMKPVEYSRLYPEGREGTPYGYRRGRVQDAIYKDIRDLYQNTPIIKHYKTINHIT